MEPDKTIYITELTRLGIQLGNIRRKKNLTIAEVAKRSNVSVAFICKVEHGKCIAKVDTLLNWCKALGYENVIFRGAV